MRKLTLLGLFLCCLIFTGCGQKLGENESYYEGELSVAGVGPEISFEPTVDAGTLVLKKTFEDHSDHIFFNEGIWKNYIKEESDYLPGNTLRFKGTVEYIDGAAGNHYYNVKSIDRLEVVKYPNAEKIKEIFDGYNYCETDNNCEYFMGECPLGCYIPMNKKYIDISNDIVTNFINNLGNERCIYDCMAMNKAVCKNYKCEMINSEIEEKEIISCPSHYKQNCGEGEVCPYVGCNAIYAPVCGSDGKTYENECEACTTEGVNDYVVGKCSLENITCSPEEKSADFCTMQYEPVCGSDSITYVNSCVACLSETVESYTIGECESSAFSVEGNSNYLEDVIKILEKDLAISCNYSYNNNGTTIYGKFMADWNRFYSDSGNENYVLIIGDKTYLWSNSPKTEKIAIDSPTDIESEIASLLTDKSKLPFFQINCSGGIEDENLFTISE